MKKRIGKQIFTVSVVLLMLFATMIPCFANANALMGKDLIESYGLAINAYGTSNIGVNSAKIDESGRLVIAAGGNQGNIYVGTDLGDFNNVLTSWTIEAKLTGVSVANNWHYGIAYNNNKFNAASPSFSLRAGVYTEDKDWGQIMCTARTKTEKPYKLGQPETPVAEMSAANGVDHVFTLTFDAESKTFIHKLDGIEVARIVDTKNETSLSEFSIMIPNRQTVAISYMKASDNEGNVIYYQDFSGKGSEDAGVKHTVTVNYVYADGTTSAPTATRQVSEGKLYAIQSPKIDGCLPDQDAVYGKMGTEDITVTVTYSSPLKLTIHYVKADGTKMFDDYVVENLSVGEAYSVASMVVANYSVEPKIVEGVMGNEDKEITVVYTPAAKKFTLMIKYVYADRTQAAATYTEQYSAGSSYSVESPVIEGHTPDQAVVSADSINSNLTVTVTYTANEAADTNTGADNSDAKSGCGSVLGSVSAIPMVIGMAWFFVRKKEN